MAKSRICWIESVESHAFRSPTWGKNWRAHNQRFSNWCHRQRQSHRDQNFCTPLKHLWKFIGFDPSPHLVTSHCALCLWVFAFRFASFACLFCSRRCFFRCRSSFNLCDSSRCAFFCNSFFHLWSNLRTAITLSLAILSALRRFLYSFFARNLCGRCSFLSFTAICCSSQNSKCLLRFAELESYQPRSFSRGLVLSIPTPSHIFFTASCSSCHRSSNSTRP